MMLDKLLAVLTAAATLLSGSMNTAMPDKDFNGYTYLINRTHPISQRYVPNVRKVIGSGMSQSMRETPAAALEELFEGAAEDGIKLSIVSGYRSYEKQSSIYARKKGNVGEKRADLLVAKPGTSEHQLGLAMDLAKRGGSQLNSQFAKTAEGKWVYAHCHEYGFIVRYLEGYEDVTGYSFEPWHIRYVGRELAQAIHDSGLPYETFMSNYKLEIYEFLISQSAE